MSPEHYADIAGYYNLLYRLGVTADHTDFFYTAYAICLAVSQPQRLLFASKWLYPAVAKQYNTSRKAVARGIHSVILAAWENNPILLSEFAHQPLDQRPSPSQFIAILAAQFIPVRVA